MQFEITKTNTEDFKTLREKRGIWAVKHYLHRWYEYKGEEHFAKYRKKHNRTFIEVATHQHLVDQIKPFFGLQQIGTKILFDEIEGYGVMQKWWPVIGTVKQREFMAQWVSTENLLELFKICLFDGVIGGLDRHGNNVLVLPDKTLLTIDDEDVFYGKLRIWIKFDKDIKRMTYFAWLRNQKKIEEVVESIKSNKEKILEIADCPVMRDNEEFKFYDVLKNNLDNIDFIYSETIRQLLL